MELEIFQSLKTIIKTIPSIKTIKIFRNSDLDSEKSIKSNTACLISFQNMFYSIKPKYVETCTLDVVVRLVCTNYQENFDNVFALKEVLNSKIVSNTDYNFVRKETINDEDSESVYVYTTVYSTQFVNDTRDKKYIEIGAGSGTNWNFDITLQQDSNYDSVFSGTNFFI